ncbi:glycoside hydrolase family 43 protein [Pedobacter sp. P351]|uniref:glycoside hydrolase family 43 protein n=1 Tax=Pedobacter superstes TaxID=3133441 RepID=UPI0030B0CDE2
MKTSIALLFLSVLSFLPGAFARQTPAPQTARAPQVPRNLHLKDIMLRDACILPDEKTGIYYMTGPGRGASVVQYTSKDLLNWYGPQTIFRTPEKLWGDTVINSIWAPELQAYKGKYYLFLTFSTNKLMPEQWLNWRPRVVRASQILVGDTPAGPFKPFKDKGATPPGMMTLDATLYVEDGKPHMVYAHEWVQISNGTIETIPLKDDLSDTIGPPKLLFRANSAPWVEVASKEEGCYVTDAPYFHKSKSGTLFMIWSSFTSGGYSVGTAISESGKLAGPWTHDPKALYTKDGGHGMLFKRFSDNQLMMILHSPNGPQAQPHLFEMEDTGSTLRVIKEFR